MDTEIRQRMPADADDNEPASKAKTVKALIALQFDHRQPIQPTQNLVTDLKGDSLDLFELVMKIEDEFNIEIEDHAAGLWKTVQDVIDTVEKVTAQ